MKNTFYPYTWFDRRQMEPYRVFTEQTADICRAIDLMLDMAHWAVIGRGCRHIQIPLDSEGVETCLLGAKQAARLLEEKALDLIQRQNRRAERRKRRR